MHVHVATSACKVVALLAYYRQSENENKIKFLKVVKYYFNVFFTTRSNRFLNYTLTSTAFVQLNWIAL